MEIHGSIVWKGKIVFDNTAAEVAAWAVEKLGVTGPAVVQMRQYKILEVNPRIGGSSILSVAAGVNIPLLAVKLFLGEKIEVPRPRELTMARYYEEAYF
jgi:carbamoyl-phosphate synthase large subunit